MKSVAVTAAVVGMWCATARGVAAQDAPARIGPFVVDVRGVVPRFGDSPELADSRGLNQAEMPGTGLGLSAGVHLYLPKVIGLTVGLGGEAMIGRSQTSATTTVNSSGATTTTLRAVSETFKTISPQLSLNFAGPSGWSYLSGGIGRSIWSIVPDDVAPRPLDDEIFSTINYGGGARWFIKPRIAFSLDVRFYQIAVGTAVGTFPGSPRTVLLVIGAGLSLR
jgi:hypothetical protein